MRGPGLTGTAVEPRVRDALPGVRRQEFPHPAEHLGRRSTGEEPLERDFSVLELLTRGRALRVSNGVSTRRARRECTRACSVAQEPLQAAGRGLCVSLPGADVASLLILKNTDSPPPDCQSGPFHQH